MQSTRKTPFGAAALALASLVLAPSLAAAQGASLTTVVPTAGPTVGGITLDIAGTSLNMVLALSVGGADCPITSQTDTAIQCTLPAGMGANVPIVGDIGNGRSTNTLTFSYAPPMITSVAPVTGPAAGGITLTINGINFGSSGSVTVGGAACPVTSYGQTTIKCTLPSGSGTVPLVVVVGGQASTPFQFHYASPPLTDAGVDAGTIADAGTDAGTLADAGTQSDAGMMADAGTSQDAGTLADAGTAQDAGTSADGGSPAGDAGTSGPSSGGGCSCDVPGTGHAHGPLASLALLAGLAFVIRRRRT